MRGFTLLEVMVALAIMAGVTLTVLGTVNYHLAAIAAERDSTALTLLALAKLAELEQLASIPDDSGGTLAPRHPELYWRAVRSATEISLLGKLELRVWYPGDKGEVMLERYLTK